jgi:glycosyltransferase involved in cell wall biosynthesis
MDEPQSSKSNDHSHQHPPPSRPAKAESRLRVKISVVIPAYNAARFLPRCLKSVYAQTLKPEEVIVVDDGSTDNTAALAAELGAKVISRPNSGPAAARNAGIYAAASPWIALLDADDMWAPDKLERQAACIRPGTVLVYTGVTFFDDRGFRNDGGDLIDPVSAKTMLRYANPIPSSSVLVHRETIAQQGGFREDIRNGEDWEMWFRMRHLGQFAAVTGPLTEYYVYPNSLSSNPARMIDELNRFIDTTLVADLRGFQRWAWRRRIRAAQLYSAGLIARENGLKDEFRYMLQSLCAWPSPVWKPKRFSTFAVSVRNRLRRRHGT